MAAHLRCSRDKFARSSDASSLGKHRANNRPPKNSHPQPPYEYARISPETLMNVIVHLFEKIPTEQAHELPQMICGGDVVGSLTSIKGAIEGRAKAPCAVPTFHHVLLKVGTLALLPALRLFEV
jgi:hypothetical protein